MPVLGYVLAKGAPGPKYTGVPDIPGDRVHRYTLAPDLPEYMGTPKYLNMPGTLLHRL